MNATIREAMNATIREAIENNDISLVRRLVLEQKVDVNETECRGYTPLLYATLWQRTDIVEFLWEVGADIYRMNHAGQDAFEKALIYRNFDILRILAKGVNTPLIRAVRSGNEQIASFLVDELKASVDLTDVEGNTAIMIAAQNDHSNIVDFLIRANARIDIHNQSGQTALSLANRDSESFKLLSKRRAFLKALTFYKMNKHIPTDIAYIIPDFVM